MLEYILVAAFVMFVVLTVFAFYTDGFKYTQFEDKVGLVVMVACAGAVWPITVSLAIFAGFCYLMFMASTYVAEFIKGMLRNE